MNSAKNLSQRLLKLYPVKALKEFFDPDTTTQAEQIPEIVNGHPFNKIKNFALDNYNLTKQHIFLFKLNKKFVRSKFNSAGFPIPVDQELIQHGGHSFKFLHKVDFDTTVLNPYEQVTISFYQPIIFSFRNDDLIIQATILEKNMDSYFSIGRRVVDSIKQNGEGIVISDILDFVRKSGYQASSNDLNKGIKALWENKVIDSKYAKWKKDRSTTTEVMDEEYTLRDQYPEVYKALIKSPLNKMIFKYKLADQTLCNHFTVDPTGGTLNVTIYPETPNQIENVIREILSNN